MGYTDEQYNAITTTEQNVLLLAGAGTGKTHTSIGRLRYLIEERFVNPRDILCLTFTRSAAEEFKFRCSDLAELPFIGTFHEFCYRLLCSNTTILNKLGYAVTPHILEDFEEKEYKTKLKMQLGIKLSDKKLNNRKLCSNKELFDFDTFHKGLTNAFRKDGVINFDQLSQNVCNLFISNDESIQPYKFQYKYIFVDEFQNTDDTQWEFVKSFSRANRFLVGDMMQSIYLFRNASPQITADIVGNEDWAVLKLTENFRSNQEILDLANTVEPSDKYANYRVNLVSSRGAGGKCEKVSTNNRQQFEQFLLSDLECSESNDIAILTRTNWGVQKIQELLESNGIPYETNNNNRLEDFEHFVGSVQKNSFLISYLASKLSSKEYYKFISDSYFGSLKNANTNEIIQYLYIRAKDVVGGILNKVNHFRHILFTENTNEHKYLEICEMLELLPLDVDEYQSVLDEESTNSDIYEIVLETYKQHNCKENAIYVGTIHSAQGLEYDTVILTDVGSKEFQLDKDENKFLYYVGITRAKNNLTVYTVGDNA